MVRLKGQFATPSQLRSAIGVALGKDRADLVIKNSRFLDVFTGCFRTGDIAIAGNCIVGIGEHYEGEQLIDATDLYLVPGFIDSHVHIESSLMIPEQFAGMVLPHGTTTAIWDPHEIANVKGLKGIDWALEAANRVQMDLFVMVPSCVPSTTPAMDLESSGATLNAADLREYRNHPKVLGLAEMMNYPGVLFGDDDVLNKLTDYNQMIRDGHCPLLSGKELNAYALAGIQTCHESTSQQEALEKLSKGVHLLIREGSCAKDASELLPLLTAFNSCGVGFCSDDRNPLDILEEGHLNYIVNKALMSGIEPATIFRAASYGPALIYGLRDRGAIAPGYLADFCLVRKNQSDWRQGMTIESVYKSGSKVEFFTGEPERTSFPGKNMNIDPVKANDFIIPMTTEAATARVIKVIPGKIITHDLTVEVQNSKGDAQIDIARDILKIAVLERHHRSGNRTVGFVNGFSLTKGAIATSINHDSHNIITVGASNQDLALAVNELIRIDGGIVVWDGEEFLSLPLPVGGLMSYDSPVQVANILRTLKAKTAQIGCQLVEPFLQLSFLALPVIPELKITDRGLVDVTTFSKCAILTANS